MSPSKTNTSAEPVKGLNWSLTLFRFPDDASVVVIDGLGNRSLMTLGEAFAKHKIDRDFTGADYALKTKGESVHLGLRIRLLAFKVGKWSVDLDPPPIPSRNMDWAFSHEDFDASWEGEEDGYVTNGLSGYGASPGDCLTQIAEIEEDKDMPLTLEAA